MKPQFRARSAADKLVVENGLRQLIDLVAAPACLPLACPPNSQSGYLSV